MIHDDLGDRMKKYEYITRTHLVPRTPVIIRLDGKAFHTFTRGFKRPFDDLFIGAMQDTMQKLCENIQGCVLGYTQSDEITLVLVDYKKLTSSAWFDYNIQKCCSVAASIATLYFNQAFRGRVNRYRIAGGGLGSDEDYFFSLLKAYETGALFDARAFNVPKEEVTNCLLWRQNDAVRNSIQSVGQAHFSHKQLHGKNCSQIKQMLEDECDIVWELLPTHYKRGSCCVKTEDEDGRHQWIVDTNIPIFKGADGRGYIEKLLQPEDV